ncbi:MAG: hypothetical protein ACOVQE_00275 [Chitinophagaceae bacterium]
MVVLVGYLASAFLAYSLVVNNALKFRYLNILGCISFIIYGLLINAFPVILANSILLLINIYQLIKLYKAKEQFCFIPIKKGDLLIENFLLFHQKDIQAYFPEFAFTHNYQSSISFVVLRDTVISNIFIAELDENGNAWVNINYTVPQYRDFKVGKFIFDRGKDYLIQQGVQHIRYQNVSNKGHLHFLQVMGFKYENWQGTNYLTKHLV